MGIKTHKPTQGNLDNFETLNTKAFHIGFYAQRCPGKHSPNEDTLGLLTQGKTAILAIADGVGGSPNGEVASNLVVDQLLTRLKKLNKIPSDLADLRAPLLESIEKSNAELINHYVGARTTLTVCLLHNNEMQSLQIGDSSLLLCGQKGLLKHKALEHSPVGLAVAAGLLQEREALIHPERHFVSNVVGETNMHMLIGPRLNLASNDTILLASDGLFDNFLTEELVEIIRKESLEEVLNKLTELCQQMRDNDSTNKLNKIDDVSFIVCRQVKH